MLVCCMQSALEATNTPNVALPRLAKGILEPIGENTNSAICGDENNNNNKTVAIIYLLMASKGWCCEGWSFLI